MTQKVIIPVLISFAITSLLGPVIIPLLRKMKAGQTEREELKSHQKKTGTPTMGGLMILAGIIATSLLYMKDYPKIMPILFVTVGFGVVGFLDDFLKVFALYLCRSTDIAYRMLIPFTGGFEEGVYLDLGWLAIPVMFLAIIGTVNGANFTDGLDGLASSVTVLIATFFSVVAIGTHSGIEPITCAVVGALLGFLLFNVYPASVFMGDTGSLALGGFVASTAYMMQMPMFILIVALIYWVELLSVMIQVTYFRKTGGKRIFRMAPIHHHFELGGWSETRVGAVFSITTAILCLVGLLALS